MDRITLLASLTKDANSIVDVGCDHGYVAIKALEEYGVKHAYLLDINEQPLENARKNVINKHLEDRTTFLLSDGLVSFSGEMDTLVIAGMGGVLISSILDKSLEKAKQFKKIILAPNNEVDKLRTYLISHHFIFDDEDLIKDGKKCYEIITCHFDDKVKGQYSLLDMKFGPILRKKESKLFDEQIAKRQAMLNECLKKANDEVGKSKIKVELAFIAMLRGTRNGK